MECWINGKLVSDKEATISMFDRAYLYGEGVFETLKSYDGKPAFADRHYRRIHSNCEKLNIPLPLSEKEFTQALTDTVKANQLKEAAVRITVSTVGASFGVKRPDKLSSNITIFASPITTDPKLFETGVTILPLTSFHNDSREVAGIKSTSYIIKMLARAASAQEGTYETLLKNEKGNWVEGSRTNFFIVSEGTVITPPLSEGLLPGITREVVLEILKEKKMKWQEAPITDAMLKNADEIFLTGSTSEVMPVVEILGVWKESNGNNRIAHSLQKFYIEKLRI